MWKGDSSLEIPDTDRPQIRLALFGTDFGQIVDDLLDHCFCATVA